MKKRVLLFMLAAIICFAFTACGGGDSGEKAEKTYDVSDETGIINAIFVDDFEKKSENFEGDTTNLYLSGSSPVGGWVYVNIIVEHQDLYEHSLAEATDTRSSYLYAEDIATEETEMFGLKGNPVC